MGAEASHPVNAATRWVFLRWGNGALLRTLWTTGSKYGHYSGRICSSDVIDPRIWSNALPNRSTASLLKGEYVRVKWWENFRSSERSRTVTFLKWVGPSGMGPLETPNAAAQSMMTLATFLVEVSGKSKSHLLSEWSSHTMRMYFSPEVEGEISL